jgi:hypothetical protein
VPESVNGKTFLHSGDLVAFARKLLVRPFALANAASNVLSNLLTLGRSGQTKSDRPSHDRDDHGNNAICRACQNYPVRSIGIEVSLAGK